MMVHSMSRTKVSSCVRERKRARTDIRLDRMGKAGILNASIDLAQRPSTAVVPLTLSCVKKELMSWQVALRIDSHVPQ